jgi:hypothetical protein
VTVTDIADRSGIGVPMRAPRSFVPDSLVHPAAGPTDRVRAGIARNLSAVPELFADRALSVTRSFRETEGQPLVIRRARMIASILADRDRRQDGEVIQDQTRKPWVARLPRSAAWVERTSIGSRRAQTPFFVVKRPSAYCATGPITTE